MLNDVLIKELCEKISQEKDEQHAAELLACLRRFIELESEEARLRIRQILLHYHHVVPTLATLTDPRPSSTR
jgi:hypothetical protein